MHETRTALVGFASAKRVAVSIATALSAGACATAPASDAEPPPAERLTTGLAALESSEYGDAYDNLILVRSVCGDAPLGQQALLVLAAAELDPRNPERQLELAREFAAHYLSLPNRAAWAEPLAESLYLLSMEMGAADAVGMRLGGAATEETRAVDDEAGSSDVALAGPSDASLAELRAERAAGLRRAVFGFVPTPVPPECGAEWREVDDSGEPPELPVLPLSPVTERIVELEEERVELLQRQGELEDEVAKLQSELERIRETLRP